MNIEMKAITRVQLSDVLKVYSGRHGCACGCRGNYHVNPQHRALADRERGYPYDDSEINLAQVKKVLRILQRSAREVKAFAHRKLLIYSLESPSRLFAVYALNRGNDVRGKGKQVAARGRKARGTKGETR
jgi:hypothetical protein